MTSRNTLRAGRPTKFAGFAALAALTLALNIPAEALAAPLGNGNFETPATVGYTTITAPGALGAWKVTGGTINQGTSPAQTPCVNPGGHCIDLNGNAPGMIIQTFDTVCQPKYQVDFFMSRHVVLGKTPATMSASINSTNVGGNFTHSAAGVSATDGKWEAHSFTFVATSPTTTLSFKSTTNGSNPAAGPQVDNVTIRFIGCA